MLTTINDITLFYAQYAMTLITIISIPTLLWYIRKERFEEERYRVLKRIRLAFFILLAAGDFGIFAVTGAISFFYLGAMTCLSMAFAFK